MTAATSVSPPLCPQCQRPIEPSARFCRHCGSALGTMVTPSKPVPAALAQATPAPEDDEPPLDEVVLPAPRRIRVAGDKISLRALQQMVTHGVEWWQMRLNNGEASRQEAIKSIEELRAALGSVASQLAQGRETIRITSTLPVQRRFPAGCARCGKGNRLNARFCIACGYPLTQGTLPVLRIKTGLRTDPGRRRAMNQDAAAVERLLLADGSTVLCAIVADGMGGARAGDRASALAIETILSHLRSFCRTVEPSYPGWRDVVGAALVAANTAVFREATTIPDHRGMGTTTILALVFSDHAVIGSVGDSRAYLINRDDLGESQIMQLTVDHSMVARLVDLGQITPEEARTHPRRNVLYRSVGVEATLECDVEEHHLQEHDRLLICSDGITNELEDTVICKLVLAAKSPQAASDALVGLANEYGARDNVTAVVVALEAA